MARRRGAAVPRVAQAVGDRRGAGGRLARAVARSVVRVLSVRRPVRRYGLQLEVQLEWAGVDTTSGEAWSVGCRVPLAFCTPDVRRTW